LIGGRQRLFKLSPDFLGQIFAFIGSDATAGQLHGKGKASRKAALFAVFLTCFRQFLDDIGPF
jgi:hypothetical protein